MQTTSRKRFPKVVIGPRITLAHYSAFQRYAAQRGMTQPEVIEKALTRLPGFNTLLKEEQEAYARNQNKHIKVIDNIKRDASSL